MDRPASALAFVVVHDVAASWTTYPSCRLAMAHGPAAGLLLHVAGPTEEGFRTIDIWHSAAAHARHLQAEGERWSRSLAVPPVVRSLEVLDLLGSVEGRAGRGGGLPPAQ